MKKINLLLVFILCVSMTASVHAQQTLRDLQVMSVTQKVATPQPAMTGYEGTNLTAEQQAKVDAELDALIQQYQNSPEDINKEIWIGTSSYDLQSNGVNKHRVHNNDGVSAGVWTFHVDAAPTTTFPDRGSGFTTINDGASVINGMLPVQRIEDRRTGWGNVAILDDGTTVVVSHGPNPTVTLQNDLLVSRLAPGLDPNPAMGNWVHTPMPTGTQDALGLLWPHMDTDGTNLHVVCVTTPDGNDGMMYEGMDAAMLYFRSTDGGMTWDKQDVILPGVNATNFPDPGDLPGQSCFGGDAYTLVVEGDHVAIINFEDNFGDVDAWISHDKGETWEQRKPLDCPLARPYVADSGYSLADIGGIDQNGPGGGLDSANLATFTPAEISAAHAVLQSDGTGNAILEEDGTLHVVYGNMYLSDGDTIDGGTTFYPLWAGMSYWNSDMLDDERHTIDTIAASADVDGDGAYAFDTDIDNYFPRYGGNSLTSAPSLALTADGILFLAYTQKMENKVRPATPGSINYPTDQYYQNIYMTAAHKDLLNWQTPYDMSNNDVMIIGAAATTEFAFPHIHNNGIDNMIHTTWMWDPEPGMFVYNATDGGAGDNDEVTGNIISYLAIDALDLFPDVLTGVSTKVVANDVFKLELAPNPADLTVNVQYELPTSTQSFISVSSIIGQQVMSINNGRQAAGKYNVDLNVSELATGVYTLTFRSDDKISTQKLVIE